MKIEFNNIRYRLGLVANKIKDSNKKKLSALGLLGMVVSEVYSFREAKGDVYCIDLEWKSYHLKRFKGDVIGKFYQREEESSGILNKYCEIKLKKGLPFKKIITLTKYLDIGEKISDRKIVLRKNAKN